MASHLRILANGQPVVDGNGNQVVFANDTQGQSDASAFAVSLIQQVDEVIKYRVCAKIGESVAVSVDITQAQFEADPLASIGIDEEAQTAHLNMTIDSVEVVHQSIPYVIRYLVEAVVESYPEYLPVE